ncbi:MAG: hypothetical protein ABR903_07540 [Thermodesulfovibrionales bacterium]
MQASGKQYRRNLRVGGPYRCIMLCMVCSSVLILLATLISAASPSAQRALTVKIDHNTSVEDLIQSLGYSLKDRDIQAFLKDFMQMNGDMKSLSMIPKGREKGRGKRAVAGAGSER